MSTKRNSRLFLFCFALILISFLTQKCQHPFPSSKSSTDYCPRIVQLTTTDSVLLDSINKIRSNENKVRLDSFITTLKSHYGNDHAIVAHAKYQRGVLEYYEGNYEKARSFYQDALRSYESFNAESDFNTICKLYRNISTSFFYSPEKELDSIFYYASLGIKKVNQCPNSIVEDRTRIGLYQWAGIAARELGDLASAADLLSKGAELCKQGRGDYAICGPIIMNYSWTLNDQRQPDSALVYSELAEATMLANLDNLDVWDSAYIADIYNNRFEAYKLPQASVLALETLGKSLEINQKIRPNSTSVAINYNNIGYVYLQGKELELAEGYLLPARTIFQELKDSFQLNQNLENLADLAYLKQKYVQALEYLNIVLNYYRSTPPHFPITSALFKYEMIQPMIKKGNTLNKLHQVDSMTYPISEVLLAYNQVDSLVSDLQFSVRSEQSKVLLVGKLKPVYEKLISICEQSWKDTHNPIYLDRAFQYIERSKALVLRERRHRFQTAKANGWKTYLQRERELVNTIYQIRTKLKEGQIPKNEFDQLLDRKQQQELALKAHRDSIYRNTAIYEEYLSNTELKSKQIKRILSEEQIVIDYIVGDSNIFVGTITNSELDLIKLSIPPEDLGKYVKQLRSAINSQILPLSTQERLKNDSVFRTNSHWLYKKLIEQIQIPDDKSRFVVIPDGVLAYLPFGALLTEEEDTPEAYSSYSYLIKDKIINHQFSLAVWYDNFQLKVASNTKILAVAPEQSKPQNISISGSVKSNFSSLRYNKEEVGFLDKRYGAKALTQRMASRKNFEIMAGNYGIIHFAGHAFADLEDPYLSFLLFDTNNDSLVSQELLNLEQLENLRLNADMVVLSACQTADGNLANGEGVISLARAATLAGAKSVVSSLWLINQESKVQLFQNFYENLATGLPKDEALRNAQLIYLGNKQNNAHPFHWAGVINMGDASGIILNQDTNWKWMLGIGIIVILIFFFIRVSFKKIKT